MCMCAFNRFLFLFTNALNSVAVYVLTRFSKNTSTNTLKFSDALFGSVIITSL